MSISEEQLAEDKEFVDSDAFFILHGRVRLRAYISEVERLRAEVRFVGRQHTETFQMLQEPRK